MIWIVCCWFLSSGLNSEGENWSGSSLFNKDVKKEVKSCDVKFELQEPEVKTNRRPQTFRQEKKNKVKKETKCFFTLQSGEQTDEQQHLHSHHALCLCVFPERQRHSDHRTAEQTDMLLHKLRFLKCPEVDEPDRHKPVLILLSVHFQSLLSSSI